ncbi:MAG TPA: alkaline phosphatase family protein [Candidatus Dormibacteraeota bacterium]|nr:alkaline phosphatase family protein [Candidatus Dormibacteraeota bacterium]
MRRTWSFGMAFSLVAAMLFAATTSAGAESSDKTRSAIKHTIILYQENISFDHYFGTYGHGANGIPAGSTLTHTNGVQVWGPYAPTKLNSTQTRTCDVDHGYVDMIKMVNHGAMDQFLQFGNNKTVGSPSTTCPTFESASPTPPGTNLTALANAYYTGTAGDPNSPLQNYWSLASQYTLADNFFQGVYGPSTPGAQWLVAATNNTPGDPNPIGDVCNDYPASISPQNIPNLGAEATAEGTSWAWFQGGFGICTPTAVNGYSAHHNPFQYFTSTADLNHAYAYDPNLSYPQANRHQRDLSVLYAALAETPVPGQTVVPKLPSISWVKAPQIDDGHPGYSGPALEDAFVGDLVAKLKASDYWKDTALFIAFDETGGWWDHVSPPDLGGHFATWINGSPNLSGCQYPGIPGAPCGEAGLGPRMPALVISRFARKGFVDHNLLNTASLAKWVEWNHRLPALGVWGNRDVTAGSLVNAFRFGEEDRTSDQ